MTRINKLVMHGFKSFAKFTDITFGERFNCVVGPNGSGKSNIMDAISFVLGKTSSKSMRAEKSANLIYNGGKSKKPGKKGEVSIFFDNKDKTFPTEDSEVKITRIIKNNGQSIYKINDQTRTRQQIVDLLNIAKIDPDGYNIILQGDIIRFCEMATTERRLLIEEISGISVYEDKKHKAVNQLNKVEERLKEAEIVLAERQTYLKELKKDRDQALKFKELNDNIRKYKASLLKFSIDKKELEAKELKEKIDKNAKSLEEFNKKIAERREDIKKRKEDIENITKEIEEKGETNQVNLNREIENLKIEITKKNSRLETVNNELSKVDQRKNDLSKGNKDIEEKIGEVEKEKSSLEKQRSDFEKEIQSFEKKIADFKKKNKIEDMGDIEKKIDEIDSSSEELSKEINLMREKQHDLLREKDKVEHELSTLASAIEKVAQVEKEHKKQLEELEKKRSDFKKTTLELNKHLDEDSHLAAKTSDVRNELHRENEELAKLNARQASIQEFSVSDKAVQSVLKKKKQGVYGTVSELGSVDTKYSVALEVAAGARLKSIVVDDDRIAAEQIKFLRQNKLGVATFLPLNKVKSRSLDEKGKKLASANGSLGVAKNLVKHDSKFNKVFSHIFGDTLIVESIEVARRIGIGSAKMVSLEGDVAELSGAMKGGFRDKKRRGLGFKEDQLDKDLQKISNKVSDLEQKLSSFEGRRTELETLISELRTKKGELEGEIIKEEKSLHLDSSDIGLSKKKKEDLDQSLQSVEKEVNTLQDSIAEKNRELAKMKSERNELRSKISSLRNPTLIAELSTYEEKRSQIKDEIRRVSSEIQNIDIQIKDIFLPEIDKTKSIVKQIEKEKGSFAKESEEIKSWLKKENEHLKKKEEEARSFYAKFKELFNDRSKLTDEINKRENEISSLNEKSREIEIKNNTVSIKNAEISASLAGLKEDFSQYEGVPLEKEKNEEQLKYQVQKFEKMKDDIGNVNMRALEIYEEIEKEYGALLEKKDTLGKEKDDVETLMAEIEGKKKELFMETFDSVHDGFQKIFSDLSRKGEASLELEDKEDPFSAGVNIRVRLSGQKFLDIRSLSGGEKTMTALAFIFAIQEHDPASFYILDEVDAALDKHNSEKLAKLVRSYSDKAQYVMISHNDGVISEADNLYGISMDEHGMSKVVSLKI